MVTTRRRARFHELEVAEVRPLTAESVEVTFAVPPELHDEYDYLAGQYVALRATIDGHELRRSYSICRPPTRGRISTSSMVDSFSASMRPDSSGAARCSRDSTWCIANRAG